MILGVFKAEEWDNLRSGDGQFEPDLWSDHRRAARRLAAATPRSASKASYTTIETNLVKRPMIEVILADAELAFRPLSPVKFNIDRLETNPRFAAISRSAECRHPGAVLRIDMEDRGGNVTELLLPYATIELIRDVSMQMFMKEKLAVTRTGKAISPPNWARPKSPSMPCFTRRAAVKADYEARCRRHLDARVETSDAPVIVRCGDVTLSEGRMGRVGDRVAVRVTKPLRKPSTTFAMFEMAGGSGNRLEAQ